jgi:hypothetical protein
MALAWLFSNNCSFFSRSCWPLHQISDPYNATDVTAATTTVRIRLMDKPPLLLLRLATRCKAPLALAILFSKGVLKDSFRLSQKPSLANTASRTFQRHAFRALLHHSDPTRYAFSTEHCMIALSFSRSLRHKDEKTGTQIASSNDIHNTNRPR